MTLSKKWRKMIDENKASLDNIKGDVFDELIDFFEEYVRGEFGVALHYTFEVPQFMANFRGAVSQVATEELTPKEEAYVLDYIIDRLYDREDIDLEVNEENDTGVFKLQDPADPPF